LSRTLVVRHEPRGEFKARPERSADKGTGAQHRQTVSPDGSAHFSNGVFTKASSAIDWSTQVLYSMQKLFYCRNTGPPNKKTPHAQQAAPSLRSSITGFFSALQAAAL